jgi:putative ATPase
MECLPPALKDRRYYLPTEEGLEVAVKERLDGILEWKNRQD